MCSMTPVSTKVKIFAALDNKPRRLHALCTLKRNQMAHVNTDERFVEAELLRPNFRVSGKKLKAIRLQRLLIHFDPHRH
ncbi:hypothetical protein NDU88_000076 [Pleurodeles waltl]|uniref:Uncharacterized protein n=1 Tax=Pleurodeles waltl TaxID=8319 RepID=A0AAV7VV26_PLEWA|nr:hypothetical protein NDU88_000076 [Pleurodeles waltl]